MSIILFDSFYSYLLVYEVGYQSFDKLDLITLVRLFSSTNSIPTELIGFVTHS